MRGRTMNKVQNTYCSAKQLPLFRRVVRTSKGMGWVVLNVIEDHGGTSREITVSF